MRIPHPPCYDIAPNHCMRILHSPCYVIAPNHCMRTLHPSCFDMAPYHCCLRIKSCGAREKYGIVHASRQVKIPDPRSPIDPPDLTSCPEKISINYRSPIYIILPGKNQYPSTIPRSIILPGKININRHSEKIMLTKSPIALITQQKLIHLMSHCVRGISHTSPPAQSNSISFIKIISNACLFRVALHGATSQKLISIQLLHCTSSDSLARFVNCATQLNFHNTVPSAWHTCHESAQNKRVSRTPPTNMQLF